MKLIKYDNYWNDPFADFEGLFDRVFRDRGSFNSLFQNPLESEASRGFRLDSYAHDDGYSIVAELPGIPKESIELKLENAVLTISGEHQEGAGDHERRFSFSRSVTVGDDIDADKVVAKLENGLLTVSLPKVEACKPKAIEIH